LALGVGLLVVGAAMLGRVAYDLWGTGVGTARAQVHLRAEFDRVLAHPKKARPVLPGGAVGLIVIPRLNLDMAFVEGISLEALAKGPGHYPGTPLPGHGGNVAIAGHRTTHLSPFWALDTMQPGDDVTLITREGRFVYRTMWVGVANPDADWVLAGTGLPTLTLTTCYPRFSSTHRLILRAVQVYGRTGHGFVDHLHESLQAWMRPPSLELGHQRQD
jgi:sortase A